MTNSQPIRNQILSILLEIYNDRPFKRSDAINALNGINVYCEHRENDTERRKAKQHTLNVYFGALTGNKRKIMFNAINRASTLNHRGIETDAYLIQKLDNGLYVLHVENVKKFLAW